MPDVGDKRGVSRMSPQSVIAVIAILIVAAIGWHEHRRN